MVKSAHPPTEGELQILQVLWKEGPSTVKTVNDILNVERNVGYTTTLKILQIMFEKGLVSREKSGKSHVYTATISLEDTRQQVIDRVLDSVFQGSAMKLVIQALGNSRSSREELKEIRKYLEKLDSQDKKEDSDD